MYRKGLLVWFGGCCGEDVGGGPKRREGRKGEDELVIDGGR